MSETLSDFIEERLGARPVAIRRFAGGDIAGASLVELPDGTRIVAKSGPVVAIEARMLHAMAKSAAPIPDVLVYSDAHVLIEYRPSEGSLRGHAWPSLADALIALHAIEGDTYGWAENYALRHVRVENEPCESWPQFWADRRLRCHLGELPPGLSRRVEALSNRLGDILPPAPKAALLHGDLWGGNVLVSDGAVSGLIDPCACHGDREVDAASLTAFDSPPDRFFDALDLAPEWRERQPVYRLWMWLIHVRLFGEGYRSAAERDLEVLGF